MINSRDYALRLIEFRDRTEKELREKLVAKGYIEEQIEDTIEFLKNYGYIDDGRYASHFTQDAINLKKWGKIRIRTELLRKGIDREIVDFAIEDAFSKIEVFKTSVPLTCSAVAKYSAPCPSRVFALPT